MFKSATGFLWGQPANDEVDDSKSTSKPHAQGSHSLTDIDNLSLDTTNDKQHHQRHSIVTSSPLSYHQFPPKGDPIEIVLDKDSKFKLSATSSISFLFPTDEPSQSKRRNAKLSRSPFYIESNRNARYVARIDKKQKSSDTESDDSDEKIDNTATELSSAQVNVEDLHAYLDSLSLTSEEKKNILTLCEWVKTDKVSIRLSKEMWMAELVISYFSSLSPTNPDMFGCWRRWAVYRADHASVDSALYNVSATKLRAFLDSGVFSIGFDKERRPVWFLNTEHYDDSFGADVVTKACTLFAASLHWDLRKNELDLLALRRGICVYANLSHWSINMISWGTIAAAKKALVAFPYHLVQIYVSNIPTFMYLLKQLAAKVVPSHAMEKVKILADSNEYFEQDGYAHKHETPLCAGGTLRVSATQWLKDRGFLDLIDEKAQMEKNEEQLSE